MMINKKLIKPSIIAVTTYLLCYQIPKVLISEERIHFLKIPLDDKVPLIKPFIIVYLLAFVQWAIFMYVLMKQDTKYGYIYNSAIIMGSFIGLVILMAYPTGTNRPEIVGNSILDFLIKTTYLFDSILNAFPSFHCFCSQICLRGLMEIKGIDKKWIIINTVFSILVFASTICTKQHFILDIPGGIILAEISILIAKKYQFTKFFNNINKIGD